MVEEEWRKELESSGYAAEFPAETAEILSGIRIGVDIEFNGDRKKNRRCVNLRTATDDPIIEEKVNRHHGGREGEEESGTFRLAAVPLLLIITYWCRTEEGNM